MTFTQGKIEDLSQEELSRLVMDMFHRIVVHYGHVVYRGATPDGDGRGTESPRCGFGTQCWAFNLKGYPSNSAFECKTVFPNRC